MSFKIIAWKSQLEDPWRLNAGVALRRILRILRINIRLYGFIQSLSILSAEKSCARIHLSKGWNREWDWSTTKKKKKKAQAMTSYLKARVNMPTLGVTCTSFLIAHALLHSGACCPGRGGGIWLWCFTRQRAPMILCRSNSFLPRPSDWLVIHVRCWK